MAALLPLGADETYYWVWAQHPQLSYYDHPPMIAWLFSIGKFFPDWAVRFPGVIVGHSAILVWLWIAKDFLNESRLRWLALLLFVTPLTGLGALVQTPDTPLLFFWSLACFLFFRATQFPDRTKYWIFLGASLGLGFCSKYMMVLFVPAALLYLVWDKKIKILTPKNFAITFFFGALFSLPVVVWNLQNDFMSFRFQLAHGFTGMKWSVQKTLASYVAGQIFAVFPPILYLAIKAFKNSKLRLFVCLGFFPLAFFFASAFRGFVEVNWPNIGHLSLIFLAVVIAKNLRPIQLTIGFWSVLTLSLFAFIGLNFYPKALEKLKENTQYEVLTPFVTSELPMYADSYQMASSLWFKTKKPFYKLKGMTRFDIYDTFPESDPTQSPIYLILHKDSLVSDEVLARFQTTPYKEIDENFRILQLDRR